MLLRLKASTWACLLLLVLSLYRAGQLYHSSNAELSKPTTNDAPVVPEIDSRILPYRFEQEKNDETVMANKPSNLFYFVQVSDLHLSQYSAQGHTNHFLHFMNSVLPLIKPELVVVTGDLTDAKASDKVKTQQYPEEWEMYKAAVEEGAGKMAWYDMRGNHDCFNLESWQSQSNLYRTYGKSAKLIEAGEGIYSWDVEKPFGQYQFVVADACPKKGPARPLNFFGYLTAKTMDRLVSTVLTPKQYNHTFVFSHYPTTTMVFGESSDGYRFKDVAQRMSVYFCGHLHRLVAGLGDVLKSYNPWTDSLELELADMKDHGAFRIIAVDHDLISFIDAELPVSKIPTGIPSLTKDKKVNWPEKMPVAPIVVITNPKDSRYVLGRKEPYYRTRTSTYIRFLVFSDANPSELRVRITVDDLPHPFPAEFVGTDDTPLWVSSWEPNDFNDLQGHKLRIEVKSTLTDMTGEATAEFRMDDIRLAIGGGIGEWLIGSHVVTLIRHFTLLSIMFTLITLMGPKIYNDYSRKNTDSVSYVAASTPLQDRIMLKIHQIDQYPTNGPFQFIQRQILLWTMRYLRLPDDQPLIWYATFAAQLSLLALPWFKAEFIPSASSDENRYGTFYLWGLVFAKEWVPLADTWRFAVMAVNLDVGFLYRIFAWRTTSSAELHCLGSEKGRRQVRQVNEHPWFKALEVIFWLWRVSEVVGLAYFYGGVWPTLVLNILMIWLVFIGVMLVVGKNGLLSSFRSRHRQRIGIVANGCRACQNAAHLQTSQRIYAANNQEPVVEHHRMEERSNRESDEHVLLNNLDDVEESGSTSSHSSSASSSSVTRPLVHSRNSHNNKHTNSSGTNKLD